MKNVEEVGQTVSGSPESRGREGHGDAGIAHVRIDGRLRSYRDVRAAFEPWRRAALVAWCLRDDLPSASRRMPRPN